MKCNNTLKYSIHNNMTYKKQSYHLLSSFKVWIFIFLSSHVLFFILLSYKLQQNGVKLTFSSQFHFLHNSYNLTTPHHSLFVFHSDRVQVSYEFVHQTKHTRESRVAITLGEGKIQEYSPQIILKLLSFDRVKVNDENTLTHICFFLSINVFFQYIFCNLKN